MGGITGPEMLLLIYLAQQKCEFKTLVDNYAYEPRETNGFI
jgi:hypothetical protein